MYSSAVNQIGNKSIYDSLNKIRRGCFKIQITVLISSYLQQSYCRCWDYDNHRIYMPYKRGENKVVKDMQTSEKYRDVNQAIQPTENH